MSKAKTAGGKGTPATVAATQAGIEFTLHPYEADPDAVVFLDFDAQNFDEPTPIVPQEVTRTTPARSDKHQLCIRNRGKTPG